MYTAVKGVGSGPFKMRRRRLQFIPGPTISEAVERRQFSFCKRLIKMDSTDPIELQYGNHEVAFTWLGKLSSEAVSVAPGQGAAGLQVHPGQPLVRYRWSAQYP